MVSRKRAVATNDCEVMSSVFWGMWRHPFVYFNYGDILGVERVCQDIDHHQYAGRHQLLFWNVELCSSMSNIVYPVLYKTIILPSSFMVTDVIFNYFFDQARQKKQLLIMQKIFYPGFEDSWPPYYNINLATALLQSDNFYILNNIFSLLSFSFQEMLDIMRSIYDMMGKYTYPSMQDDAPREHVESFFQVKLFTFYYPLIYDCLKSTGVFLREIVFNLSTKFLNIQNMVLQWVNHCLLYFSFRKWTGIKMEWSP